MNTVVGYGGEATWAAYTVFPARDVLYDFFVSNMSAPAS